MVKEDKKLSEQISDFLNLITGAIPSYQYMKDKLTEADKKTQDLLHALELNAHC